MKQQHLRDQMGRDLVLTDVPNRIVSLVPSQTELLFYLGLEDKVVGVTKFCIHPEQEVKRVTKVGGTKKFRFDVIDALEPDLIIGNKEENYKEGIDRLAEKYPVWMSDINNFQDALQMMRLVGGMVGKTKEAHELITQIEKGWKGVKGIFSGTAAYFIWRKPFMTAGSETFIHEIMGHLGFQNVMGDQKRYPEMTADALAELRPQYVFLSSEPYPFDQRHLEEFEAIFPSSRVVLVDGEMFSWYGNRLKEACRYFESVLPTKLQ